MWYVRSLSIAAYQLVTSASISRQRGRQRHPSRRPKPNNANPSTLAGRSTIDHHTHRAAPRRATSRRATPHRAASRQDASHRAASHRATSHRTASRPLTSPPVAPPPPPSPLPLGPTTLPSPPPQLPCLSPALSPVLSSSRPFVFEFFGSISFEKCMAQSRNPRCCDHSDHHCWLMCNVHDACCA